MKEYKVGSVCVIISGYPEYVGKECTIVEGLAERMSRFQDGSVHKGVRYVVEVQGFDGLLLNATHEALRLKKPPRDEKAEAFLNKLVQPLGHEEMDKLRDEMKEKEEV